jgi:hypothetical protein
MRHHQLRQLRLGRGLPMKPISVWPMIALLAVVLFLILWFGGYLT